jgi:hypothetical protein
MVLPLELLPPPARLDVSLLEFTPAHDRVVPGLRSTLIKPVSWLPPVVVVPMTKTGVLAGTVIGFELPKAPRLKGTTHPDGPAGPCGPTGPLRPQWPLRPRGTRRARRDLLLPGLARQSQAAAVMACRGGVGVAVRPRARLDDGHAQVECLPEDRGRQVLEEVEQAGVGCDRGGDVSALQDVETRAKGAGCATVSHGYLKT